MATDSFIAWLNLYTSLGCLNRLFEDQASFASLLISTTQTTCIMSQGDIYCLGNPKV